MLSNVQSSRITVPRQSTKWVASAEIVIILGDPGLAAVDILDTLIFSENSAIRAIEPALNTCTSLISTLLLWRMANPGCDLFISIGPLSSQMLPVGGTSLETSPENLTIPGSISSAFISPAQYPCSYMAVL